MKGPQLSVDVRVITAFGLTREKREKSISKKWLVKGRLLRPKYPALSNFIHNNIVRTLSLDEISLEEGGSRTSGVPVGDIPPRVKRPAYVCGFLEKDHQEVLDELRETGESSFFDKSETVAEWFRQSLWWPKSYLFVAQFTVKFKNFSEGMVGVLATNLSYGDLLEHEQKIVEETARGMIRRKVRKAALYPHLMFRRGKVSTETRLKMFEDRPDPARYFYTSMGARTPFYSQSLARKKYEELRRSGRQISLSQLVEVLRDENEAIPRMTRLKILVDDVQIRVPIATMGKTAYIATLKKGVVAMVVGREAKVVLGDNDLLADRTIPTSTARQLSAILKDMES